MDSSKVLMVERPATLEELIPEEVRERWGISSRTEIEWSESKPTDIDLIEAEIAENNTIEIRYSAKGGWDSGLNKQLEKFIKAHGLPSSSSKDTKLLRLRQWAVSQGKKIRIVEE